jgi:hypothetical protein
MQRGEYGFAQLLQRRAAVTGAGAWPLRRHGREADGVVVGAAVRQGAEALPLFRGLNGCDYGNRLSIHSLAAWRSAFSSRVEIEGSVHLGTSTGGERSPHESVYGLGAAWSKLTGSMMEEGWGRKMSCIE